jgi:hypothetical protein
MILRPYTITVDQGQDKIEDKQRWDFRARKEDPARNGGRIEIDEAV